MLRHSVFTVAFIIMTGSLVVSCDNSIEDRIARNPQSESDRSSADWNAALSNAHFGNSTNGGVSAGDPGQYGCQPRDYSDSQVTQVVRSQLASLQRQSLSNGLEMCGFAIIGSSCQIRVTETTRGTSHSCNPSVPSNVVRLAIYHTHGISHGSNAGEIPSDIDFRTTIAGQIDGYVATPAGRLWRIDAFSQKAELLCRRCMPVDPNSRFNRNIFQVGSSYRYVDILAILRNNGLTAN